MTSTERVLDLHGSATPSIRHPRLVATALWLFAAKCLFYLLVPRLLTFEGPARNDVAGTLALFAELCFIVGVLLLGKANLGRRAFNPWPLWLFVGTAMLTEAIFFLLTVTGLHYLRWAVLPKSARYAIVEILPFASACMFMLALIYVLQIAAWLRSKTLALLSILSLGPPILVHLGFALYLFSFWLRDHGLQLFPTAAYSF